MPKNWFGALFVGMEVGLIRVRAAGKACGRLWNGNRTKRLY